MISRLRLLRPSRYVPIALAGLAVVMLVPADSPTDDDAAAAVLAAAPNIAPQPAPPVEPAIKIAEVSQVPPPDAATDDTAATKVASVRPVATTPPPEVPDAARQQAIRSVDETDAAIASPPADEAAAAPEEPEAEQRYRLARVGGSALNVRAGPSSSNQKLFVLRPGEPIRVTEMQDGWARIVRADGDEGWAYARYLSGLDGDALADTTAATAEPAESEPKADPAPPEETAARDPAPESGPADTGRYARIASDVPARAAPSAGAAQLFVLPAGERVKIAEVRGAWVHVVADNGVSGWVRFR